MRNISKGTEIVIEYGDYDNFVNVTPVSFYLKSYNDYEVSAVVKGTYRDGREIEFVEDKVGSIDFNSFGTTLTTELTNLGYKENEVQFLDTKLYIIKNEDGTITPFEKFQVDYDYTKWGITTHKSVECVVRGEDRAIRYAERCEYLGKMDNITVTKVGSVNE